ncbi:MAG TPA: hypothetical protein PKD45_01410 [Flavobacteriales bacterium]|nr:hypothetical protein [Flavobacteriales bacterium]
MTPRYPGRLNRLRAALAFFVVSLGWGTAQVHATTCAGAITINPASLPINNQAVVCGAGNDMNAGNVTTCGGVTNSYLGGQEALYTFTPTTTSSYQILYQGQSWGAIMVYSGCPTSGTCIGGSSSSGTSVALTVPMNAGTQYYIIFDTWPSPNSPCPGTFSIAPPPPPPANDNPCNATVVTPNPTPACTNQTAGTLINATPSGLPAAPCFGTPDNDVWYRFTATNTTHYINLNNVTGNQTDMYHAVYSGTCGSLTNISCSDPNSSTVSGLVVGQTYWIRVYTYFSSTSSDITNFNICVSTPGPPPANDNPCNAQVVTPNTALACTNQTPGTTGGATPSGVPTTPCYGTPDNDVWYRFTATSNIHFINLNNINGTTTDMYIAVYSGTCSNLTNIACSDPESLTLNGLVIGQTYWIRIYTYFTSGANDVTNFDLCITTQAPMPILHCGQVSYDPGGAAGNYPNGSNFTQTICPTNSGDAVTLTFTMFNTEGTFDVLTIYDGPSTSSPMLGSYSGSTIPGPITASDPSGCLTLRFTSDASVNYAGWAANITCSPWVPPPPTCGTVVYDPGGAAGNYPNNSNITQTFCPDNPGDVVTLIFTSFQTESYFDVLTIYDGPNTAAPTLGSYSGTDMPPVITSSHPSGCITIRFTSDGSVNYSGWSALVNCQPLPAGACVYALIMTDSGNNGWGSSAVRVRINGGPWTSYTVTGSSNVILLGVNLGDLIEAEYIATGPNQNQNRYTIGKLGQFPYFTSDQPPAAGITFSQIVNCGPPPSPPQDCMGGITVCSSLAINNTSTSTGLTADLNSTNQGCLSSGERQGTWYFFSPQTAGTIGFSISPANSTDDYDFAVWGPYTAAQCPSGPPLRCSYNAPPSYVVGLGNGATDLSEGAGGDGWVKTINVLADEVYVLYIDNFSTSGQAFTLNWNLSGGVSLDCTTLPVELLTLEARPRRPEAEVLWATTTEQGTSHFIVERSLDNEHFTPIGTMPAAGNSVFRTDYLFVDHKPYRGINYYRLQQVDLDGATTRTHVVTAILADNDHRPTVFPNPAKDVVNVSLNAPSDGIVTILLQDALGRVIASHQTAGKRGDQILEVPVDRLAKGWYNLRLMLPDGSTLQSEGFLKE